MFLLWFCVIFVMTTFWVSIWFKSFHLLCLKEVVFFPFPSFNLMPFWTISKMYKHFRNKKKTLLLGGYCHFCAHISAHSSRYWFFNYFRVAFFLELLLITFILICIVLHQFIVRTLVIVQRQLQRAFKINMTVNKRIYM